MERYKRRDGETYKQFGRRLYELVKLKKINTYNLRDIMNKEFSLQKGESAFRKFFKAYTEGYEDGYQDKCDELSDNRPRLVISDIHLPFAIDGWLDFIKDTHKRFNCHDEIIINGDLWDFHDYSFHTSETDSDRGIVEFEKAKLMTKQLVEEFPHAKLSLGNHDLLIARKLKEIGIDKRFIKTFHELFDLPKTWELAEEFIIDNVYYRHIGCNGGVTGHRNSAISNMMSTVSSHLHSYGGVSYIANPTGETIFGLNSGALVDDESYALRYGKLNRFKSTLGCGVVYSDKEAYFVPFTKKQH